MTLCEYELQRLAHIRRNQECLARLGLADASFMAILNPGAAKKEKKPRAPRPKQQPVDESQCRRSLRAKGGTPEYTGQQIDTVFDGDRR